MSRSARRPGNTFTAHPSEAQVTADVDQPPDRVEPATLGVRGRVVPPPDWSRTSARQESYLRPTGVVPPSDWSRTSARLESYLRPTGVVPPPDRSHTSARLESYLRPTGVIPPPDWSRTSARQESYLRPTGVIPPTAPPSARTRPCDPVKADTLRTDRGAM
ncbi:unnamed protein product [Boreogadus saida]